MTIKKVKAPVRIDFAGGTTDINVFAQKYGGAVLNAAIDKYVQGEIKSTHEKVGLNYSANIPTSSGLGTSGAMTLVWLALIEEEMGKRKLAEEVYEISRARGLGNSDGKQDQYAAAFGGINLWLFEGGKVKKRKVDVDKKTIKELENNLLIVYLGEHSAGTSNSKAIQNFRDGKNVREMKNLKQIALDMKKALEKGDLDKFIELMNKETENREKLARGIVPKEAKKVVEKGLKHAEAAKILGAGSGGSVLFYGGKKKLKKEFRHTIDFKFDWEGLKRL